MAIITNNISLLCKKNLTSDNEVIKASVPLNKLKIVDLFCGCGGFTAGVIKAAINNNYHPEVSLAIDSDSDAINVFKLNFGNYIKKLEATDIRKLFSGELGKPYTDIENRFKTELDNVNILIAGPPCQGHSDLNNRTRRDDPRNGLYLRAIRAVEILSPEIMIVENVASVIHDKSEVVQTSINYLKKINYKVETIEINAIEYGVAQKRKRHFLLAHKKHLESSLEGQLLNLKTKPKVLKDVISDIVDEYKKKNGIFFTPSAMHKDNKKRVAYLFKNNKYNLPDDYRPNCHKNNKHSYVSMYGRLKWTEPSQTITSGFGSMGQGRFVHPSRKRVITPHEAARIQGFSDKFKFSCVDKRTKLHQMIANAVPPPIAHILASIFLQNLER